MKPETLHSLCCPHCARPLEIAHRAAIDGSGRLRDGVLTCSSCGSLFPVLGWIPRIVPESLWTEPERRWMSRSVVSPAPSPLLVQEEFLSKNEFRRRTEERLRAGLLGPGLSPKLRQRKERDLEYLVTRTEEKSKFVRTAQAFLQRSPRKIIELGGGQGGSLTAFREAFQPELALLVDLDPEWVEMAHLRDPETEVVRGDATCLPVRSGGFDLLFSSAMLEHIGAWKKAVSEMVRVAGEGLLCYNPNAGFPYDAGHLDAPLVTWLPKRQAAHVAYLSHRLRRTGRTLESIRGDLEATHYHRRSAVVRELRAQNVEVVNAFGEFLKQTLDESYHRHGAGALQILRQSPLLRGAITRAFLWTDSEPNVYLYFRRAGAVLQREGLGFSSSENLRRSLAGTAPPGTASMRARSAADRGSSGSPHS